MQWLKLFKYLINFLDLITLFIDIPNSTCLGIFQNFFIIPISVRTYAIQKAF